MCGAPEISTIVLMMGAILVLSLSGMSMNSLARRLEMFHPAEWERFKKPAYMRYFESIHDQRFEWYVLAGRYSALRDAGVTHAGNRARLLGILGMALALCSGITMMLPSYDSVFSCLPGS